MKGRTQINASDACNHGGNCPPPASVCSTQSTTCIKAKKDDTETFGEGMRVEKRDESQANQVTRTHPGLNEQSGAEHSFRSLPPAPLPDPSHKKQNPTTQTSKIFQDRNPSDLQDP